MIANAGVLGVRRGIMDGQSHSWSVVLYSDVPMLSADVELWESLWAVNVRGPLLCYKYAARQMVKQGSGGRIVGRRYVSLTHNPTEVVVLGASSICGLKGKFNFQRSARFLTIWSNIGYADLSAYCTSKASVRSLTQTAGMSSISSIPCIQSDRSRPLALEFEQHGITVNAYAPGIIETDMSAYSLSLFDMCILCFLKLFGILIKTWGERVAR